jgi:hypothetical protein
MIILAIDPGSEKSALVLYDTGNQEIYDRRILENELLLGYMGDVVFDMLVIEMIASYGMPVGKDVFETCVWIGRFIEHSKNLFIYLPPGRKNVSVWLYEGQRFQYPASNNRQTRKRKDKGLLQRYLGGPCCGVDV